MRAPEVSTGGGFDAALDAIRGVDGWLSPEQARVLWDCASELAAPARVVEIGSYRGRSTIVLAGAVAGRGTVVAVDPHAGNDRGPQQWEGPAAAGGADLERFRANLERAGVAGAVQHLRLSSGEALGEFAGGVDLLYVDGAHRFRPALGDIEGWGARVGPGGAMLIHDAFSSVGVTLAILRSLVPGASFAFEGRTGSLARYTRRELRRAERVRNAVRQLAQLGWFARNLLVKLAIVLRLRPLARALGQRDLTWPY